MTKRIDAKSPVGLMLACTFLLWFSVYTYPSFLSDYARNDLFANPVMVGFITGSYGFTQMILRIPLGIYSDVIGKRKPFLIFGMAAATAAALGLWLFRTPSGALIFRGMAGVAASTWVMFSVLYSSYFDSEATARAMGRLSSIQYGSQVVAMLLGAYLADVLGKGAAFALAGAAGAAGILLTLKVRDRPPTEPPKRLADFATVLKSRRLISATALSTIFHFICWGTVLGFTVNWAKDVVGLSTTQLGFLAAMYLLPNTIVSRFSGSLDARFGRRAMTTAGFVIIAASCALFPQTRTFIALISAQALFGLGMGLMLPLLMTDSITDIPMDKRGAAMGFYQSVYGLGMFLGPVTAGAIVEAYGNSESLVNGYIANFYAMAAISLAGAAFAFIVATLNAKKEKK